MDTSQMPEQAHNWGGGGGDVGAAYNFKWVY